MPEPADPLALEALALRYAAGRLAPAAAARFEARLADDQDARDALAEAVQLSAAALGQEPPAPDRSFRRLIRDRLRPGWRWPARRAYRGHPLGWAGLGAAAVMAATLTGLWLAEAAAPAPATVADHRPPRPQPVDPEPVAYGPAPAEEVGDATAADTAPPDRAALRAAEIWAELSTPDHAEKTHDDDARFRQWLHDLAPAPAARPAAGIDGH